MKIRNWSAYELGKRGGFAPDTAARIKRGDTNLSLNTVAKLCVIFNVKVIDELFEYTPD